MTGILHYSSAAAPTTLASPLSPASPGSTGSVVVNAITGMPVLFPFTLIVEWDTANAEVITVTQAATGLGPFTFANSIRGDDGTGAPSHSAGVSVTHGVSGRDFLKGGSDWFNVCSADYGADPTNTIDSTSAINAAIAAAAAAPTGGTVYFPAGLYKTTGPLELVSGGNVMFRGVNYSSTGSTIVSAATSSQAGMLILGTTSAGVENVSVRDLAFKGNSNSGHGIISRVEIGLFENVVVQSPSGDCFHFSWDGLATTNLDSIVMTNCYGQFPGGAGLFTDQYLTSSEFYACHFAGAPTSAHGGTYGMHIQGSPGLKFLNCHPFFFTLNGLFLDGALFAQVDGGEYESNGGTHIQVSNSAKN